MSNALFTLQKWNLALIIRNIANEFGWLILNEFILIKYQSRVGSTDRQAYLLIHMTNNVQ